MDWHYFILVNSACVSVISEADFISSSQVAIIISSGLFVHGVSFANVEASSLATGMAIFWDESSIVTSIDGYDTPPPMADQTLNTPDNFECSTPSYASDHPNLSWEPVE